MPLTLTLDVLDRFDLCISLLSSEDGVCSWDLQTVEKSATTQPIQPVSLPTKPCITLKLTRSDNTHRLQVETSTNISVDSPLQQDAASRMNLDTPATQGMA